MATTPENKVKRQIKAILKQYGVWYAMPATGGYGSSGVPDFLCCVNGHFLGIEAKAGPGVPTALQLLQLKGITEARGVSLVINESNLDMLELVIAGLLKSEWVRPADTLKPVLPPTMKVKFP